jgi:hypothetical protein
MEDVCPWTGPLHQREVHAEACSFQNPSVCPFSASGGCLESCTLHYATPRELKLHLLQYAEFNAYRLDALNQEVFRLKSQQVEGFAIIRSTPQINQNPTVFAGGFNSTDKYMTGLGVSVELGTNNYYCGTFHNDLRHGHGVSQSDEGTYNGMWFHGQRHGKCLLFTFKDAKHCYSGSFRHDAINGAGRIWSINDNNKFTYKGQFVNGKKHGQGDMTFPCGMRTFSGTFVNDDIRGQGTMTNLTNKESVSGEFTNESCTGNGTLRNSLNQVVYTGGFICNNFDGEGTLYEADGGVYTGTFANNKKHGHGKYIFPDTSVYVGSFANNVCHGNGIMSGGPNGSLGLVVFNHGERVKSEVVVIDLSN